MIGAYVPGRTPLHRLPFAAKLAGLVVVSIALNKLGDWRALALVVAATVALYAALGPPMLRRLADLRPLWPMLLAIAVLQLVFDSPALAAASVLRILALVALSALVTYTTTTTEMLETLEPLFAPLRWVGLNPRVPALAIALVLRLVPMLLDLWAEKEEAWRARSGRRPSVRLVPSFLAAALAMADHLAEALDARGFITARQDRKAGS